MAAMPELLRNEHSQPTDVGRMLWVPADQIEPDPGQVRSGLKIRPEWVRAVRNLALEKAEDGTDAYFETLLGLEPETDGLQTRPEGAWEAVVYLAQSIYHHQLLQPIIVSEQGRRYPIIAGERRFLASLLAGSDKIWCVVKAGRPADLKLRVVQWTENAHRSDLTLLEVVDFVREVAELYNSDKGHSVDRTFFEQHLNQSQAQAYRYLALAQAEEGPFIALREEIRTGSVSTLKDAVSWLSNNSSRGEKSSPRVSAKAFKLGRIEHPEALKRLIDVCRGALPHELLSPEDQDRLSALKKAKLETAQEQRAAFRMVEDLWNRAFGAKNDE